MYFILYFYNNVREKKVFKIIRNKKLILFEYIHIYSIEKSLRLSGLVLFKPVLFKGQLYFCQVISIVP